MTDESPPQIQISGIGMLPALRVDQVQEGQRIIWDFGYTTEVFMVEEVNKHHIRLFLRTPEGHEYAKRFKRDALVALDPAPT